MTEQGPIGFIGVGVMGEPMCRNLAVKSGVPVLAFDSRREPLDRLRADGVTPAGSVAGIVEAVSVVMMSLPSGNEVASLCEGEEGLIARARPGQVIVDLGTSPVKLTRSLAQAFAKRSVGYADAPVARTREAARQGTLSIMVGASDQTFRRIEPLLRCCGNEITHCGGVGAGQMVKILNNMVLFETGVAIAEALALARRGGLDPALLLETLSKGSADSFALRNHGMKAMLPEAFPRQAFSAAYALKDIGYALALADDVGLTLRGAALARTLLGEAIDAGHGEEYWPVVAKAIDAP